jgi:S-adenosylhomocysteine hydrolase
MPNNHSYPILKKIYKHYKSKDSKFEQIYILACQHLLEPQREMFELIRKFGIPTKNFLIFGKIYSTSPEVLRELQNSNFKAVQPNFNSKVPFDKEHRKNCQKIFREFLKEIKGPAKIIIIDDGGELLRVANEKYLKIKKNIDIVGIEQTSSGFRKLEHVKLNFPIVNVARSETKLIKESPLIADLGCRRILDVFKKYKIKKPRILVVGIGPIGSNVISILKKKKYFAISYDIAHHAKKELLKIVKEDNINIVIGATGANIINEEQLRKIKTGVKRELYLISMSSADREFPAVYIRKHRVLSENIHGDVAWDNIFLVNNGFPITFKGNRNESSPQEIEKTIGLLMGATLNNTINHHKYDNKFINVPQDVVNIIEKYE